MSGPSIQAPLADDTPVEPADDASYPPLPEDPDQLPGWSWDVAATMMGDNQRTLTAKNFRILTDHPVAGAEQDVLQNLEAFFGFYIRVMSDLVRLRPVESRANLFYFTGEDAMARFAKAHEVKFATHTRGLYSAPLRFLAFDGTDTEFGDAHRALFHEATHLFNSTSAGDERGFDWWLDEGLAVYFGETKVDRKGYFEAGAIRVAELRTRFSRYDRSDIWDLRVDPREALRDAFLLYTREEHIPIDTLVGQVDGDWVTEEQAALAYTESWALVHYLLHGRGGQLRPRLADLLTQRRGRGGVEAFRATITSDLAALEEDLFAYVRRMKKR